MACAGGGVIIKTTNGGTNWTSLSTGSSASLQAICMVDSNIAYAVGQFGALIKTTDGGLNWFTQSVGTGYHLFDIKFADKYTGVICGSGGIVYSTMNGGDNWTINQLPFNQFLLGVDFTSFYVTAVGNGGTIIRSDNVLPVELSSFTASVQNQNVRLEWTTTMEENNSGFEIERKSINENNWRRIGFVQGKGTVNIAQTYFFSDKNLTTGSYHYRLKQIDYNGNYRYYDLSNEVIIGMPVKFSLEQNYPNPFNPSTVIGYQLPVAGFVSLKIYDISGSEVAQLVNEVKEAGYYSVKFDAKGLSSGTYFYKLTTDKFSDVKKMTVIK
jgi:hypothetical protein